MNRVIAISYSDKNYSMSKKLNLITAKYIGKADCIIAYSPDDLDVDFRRNNSDILSRQRGAGYWIWKPYILLKTLEKVNDGDYVIYTDAGLIYVDHISKIIELMNDEKQDIFLSMGIAPCRDWVKRDAFVLMGCDCDEAYDSIMVSGGYVVLKKSRRSEIFCKEWLRYSKDRRIITDDPNECGKENLYGFKKHRHDQAILSLMAYKYGITAYKAVSCVDQPHTHRDVYETHLPNAYGYTFNKIMELIVREHNTVGYKKASYKRMFINTRIINTSIPDYIRKLIICIINTKGGDKWGEKWDDVLIEKAQRRSYRLEEYRKKGIIHK